MICSIFFSFLGAFSVYSGVHIAEENGVAIPGSPFANDVAAIQAAVNRAADGDIIQLKAGPGGVQFDFSLGQRRVRLYANNPTSGSSPAAVVPPPSSVGGKSLTFIGIPSNGVDKPVLYRGNQFFEIDMGASPGGMNGENTQHDIVFDNLHFAEAGAITAAERLLSSRLSAFIFLRRVRSFILRNCLFTHTNYQQDLRDNLIEDFQTRVLHLDKQGFVLQSAVPGGIANTVIVSKLLLIEDNEVDLCTSCLPSDVAPRNGQLYGFNLRRSGPNAKVIARNNNIKNISGSGLLSIDNWGDVNFYDNYIESTYWQHNRDDLGTGRFYRGGSPTSGFHLEHLDGFMTANPNNYGSLSADRNIINSHLLDANGVAIARLENGGGDQKVIKLTGNVISTKNGHFSIELFGFNNVYVGHNYLQGSMLSPLMIGRPDFLIDPSITPHPFSTVGGSYVGNNLTRAAYVDAAVIFSISATNNSIVGGGVHFNDNNVLFYCTPAPCGNTLSGYTASGGVGQVISNSLKAVGESQPNYHSENYDQEVE